MEHVIQFLGRLHPLIVHLPIGFLMMTLALHAVVWRRPNAGFRELLPALWLASCVSAVVACLAGYLLSLSGDYPASALNNHMYAGIGLAVFSAVMVGALQRKLGQRLQISVAAVVMLLLIGTGHLGGNLTHGDDYLTQPLVAMVTAPAVVPVRPPITNVNEALVYADLIAPVLEQKCVQCHSAQKQKGGLRMDTEAFLLKGGKHGAVLTAGEVAKSGLYQRLLLREDDDKRMPPKAKPQLTEAEVQLIHWWISAGRADFKQRVADVPKDDAIKTMLASYGPGGAAAAPINSTDAEMPTLKVGRASPADQQKLARQGVVLTPVSPDGSFLAADMVNTPEFGDAQMSLLLPLRAQLVWLDLSATRITDKALAQIVQFKNLTRLSIDNTRITDQGLTQLKNLPALRHLNLYATGVTDQGIKSLETCKQLQTVHLWQTQVTAGGVASLKKAIGETAEITFEVNPKPVTSL